jgi:membrane-associated phospholipid phosphatase
MKRLTTFWVHRISQPLSLLAEAIGTVGLGICFILLVGLGWLFQERAKQEAFTRDTTLLLGLHQWSTPLLDQIMLILTRLGNPEFVVVVIFLSLGLLLWQQYYQEAKMLAISSLGALILNQGMKLFFARPRPALWPRLINEISYSFPSGHALGSLVLYGFLAYLFAQHFPKWSPLIYSLAVGIIALIGLSRLYLGVHWPTDIIAGYSVGFLWIVICVATLKVNGQIKPS